MASVQQVDPSLHLADFFTPAASGIQIFQFFDFLLLILQVLVLILLLLPLFYVFFRSLARSLTPDARKAAEALGWDKKMWDGDSEPTLVSDSEWSALTTDQQAAATVLGYTADNWEDDE